MINVSDSIRFTNVISRKFRFHYKEMNDRLEGFMKDIIHQNATIKGPLFYSILNVPTDEMVHAEFFMPVEEDSITLMEGMYFQYGRYNFCVHFFGFRKKYGSGL
ncbi:hypothetical protein QFZ81_000162 [Paenibacillus sp. V4I9]|uniref:DUF5085 family protein n=1 Tax=Paenibacillus sp. V4I9 TaxID=3042308 RepID=UPI00277F91F3|nr:DUF5085 family protein [Paenibacillus sp. V4I9]MDQ0885074.1 hypothetical protein [Paenibacillus sp. V4I9]